MVDKITKLVSRSTRRVAPGSAYLAVIVTVVFWSSAFVGIRATVVYLSPGSLAFLRFAIASAVLAGIVAATRTALPRLRDWAGLAFVGLVGITIYNITLNHGSQFIDAGTMSFVINTGPILTAVWARLLLNEIISRAGYFSFAVCFAGIVLIFSGETSLSLVHPAALFVAVAAIAGSLYFVIQKPFLNRYSSVQVVSVAVWCGTLFMVPFAQDVIGEVKAAPIQTLWIVVYLGVFPGALALTSWSYALSRLSASHAAIFLYCIPPATILLAWLTLGELPEITSILGGFVVLAGVALFQFYSRAPSVSVNGGAHDLP